MSRKSFGLNFILMSDVRQPLPENFQGGPWEHLATVKRGFKEYCAIRHMRTGKVYLEEVDNREPGLFKKIQDDSEWADLYLFLSAIGCLLVNPPEISVGKHGLIGLGGAPEANR